MDVVHVICGPGKRPRAPGGGVVQNMEEGG